MVWSTVSNAVHPFAVGQCQGDGPDIRVITAGLLSPIWNRWRRWCDGCRQSRTPPLVWSPALGGDRPHHSSFRQLQWVIELSLSWPCWSSKRCTKCTVYLGSVCLMTANSPLRWPPSTTIVRRPHVRHSTHRTRLGDRSFAVAEPSVE